MPDSYKALFLGVTLRAFLEEISIWFSRLSRDLPSPIWASLIQSFEDPDRTKGKGKMNSLFSWARMPLDIRALGSWAFKLRILYHQLFCWYKTTRFCNLQKADCEISFPSQSCTPFPIIHMWGRQRECIGSVS